MVYFFILFMVGKVTSKNKTNASSLWETVDGKVLDTQQKDAVLSDAPALLLVARRRKPGKPLPLRQK